MSLRNGRSKQACFQGENCRSGIAEALDDFVGIGQVVIENHDLGAPGEWRPVGHLQRHVLIIVQDGDADHCRHTPCSRGQPDSPTSIRTSLASWMPLWWGIRKPPSVVT